jgi:hypothetical protein
MTEFARIFPTGPLGCPPCVQGRRAIAFGLRLSSGGVSEGGLVQPPAFALKTKHMAMVIKSIEQWRNDHDVSQQLPPVFHRSVGRDD